MKASEVEPAGSSLPDRGDRTFLGAYICGDHERHGPDSKSRRVGLGASPLRFAAESRRVYEPDLVAEDRQGAPSNEGCLMCPAFLGRGHLCFTPLLGSRHESH